METIAPLECVRNETRRETVYTPGYLPVRKVITAN